MALEAVQEISKKKKRKKIHILFGKYNIIKVFTKNFMTPTSPSLCEQKNKQNRSKLPLKLNDLVIILERPLIYKILYYYYSQNFV